MNFDVFERISFKDKDLLLKNCRSAERNIMVSPFNAIANSRAALEILCKGLIRDNGSEQIRPGNSNLASIIEVCLKDGRLTTKEARALLESLRAQEVICRECNGQPNLASMINTCIRDELFTDKAAADTVRKAGNSILHNSRGAQKLHTVDEESVKKAEASVEALFRLMAEAFSRQAGRVRFDPLKIPFGLYDIVRAVPKAENEVIVGDYNYFVRDSQDNFYYFQILPRRSLTARDNELGARGVLAGNRIKKDKGRRSYLFDVHYPSDLLADSDREYIAYSVYSDSLLLSEAKAGQFSERQILRIGIDLADVLLELREIGHGISLRNIQPGNVIVTPNGDSYMAGVVNMETAKIEGYGATVYGSLKSLLTENPYLPPEIRRGNAGSVRWEKADVYSVAKILVYCMDPRLVKGEIDEDDLYDRFSEPVADILADIFGSSVNAIDGAAEFKEKLEDALDEL